MRDDSLAGRSVRVRVWDLPTRLVHWSLAALFAASWWTAETDRMQLHRFSGYAILGLVVFRIYWGFAGSETARFANFLKGPATFLTYARTLHQRVAPQTLGHNPMGGWSVLGLLTLLALQCGLGLFAVDVDGIESGPLTDLVSFETGRAVAHWHEFVFNLLLALVGLHLAAIIFYAAYKRERLAAAMVSGFKRIEGDAPPQAGFAGPGRAMLGIAIVAFVLLAILTRFRF